MINRFISDYSERIQIMRRKETSLLVESWRQFLVEGEDGSWKGGIPLDEWEGIPKGFVVHTHSTGIESNEFEAIKREGFRVAISGGGDLGITFIPDDPDNIKESLRKRVKGDYYNLGNTVIIAVIDPKLLSPRDKGMSDIALENAKKGGFPGGGISNPKIFEQWPEGHHWRKSSFCLPGRFILAAYNGVNDMIHINEGWTGRGSTEFGEKLANNWNEYLENADRWEEESVKRSIESNKGKSNAISLNPSDDFDDDTF